MCCHAPSHLLTGKSKEEPPSVSECEERVVKFSVVYVPGECTGLQAIECSMRDSLVIKRRI